MSRTLFVVLAVLALILSVSAQSQTSSSSSSSNSLSSSSSFVTASSSTGRSSSSSSSSSSTGAAAFTTSSSSSSSSGSSSTGVSTGSNPVNPGGSSSNSSSSTGSTNQLYATSSSSSSAGYYPDGSVGGNININIPDNVTAAVAAPLLQKDIAANVANESGIADANAVVPYVVITSFRGTALAPSSRRLLQTTSGVAAVTFIILGNITNLASQAANGFSVSNVLNTLQAAAQTGRLTASNLQAAGINATIPAQTISIFVPGQSSSTGGVGYNGASTVVSTGAALIAAAVASLALLL